MVGFPERNVKFKMHFQKAEGDMNSVEEIQLVPEQMIDIYRKDEPKVTPSFACCLKQAGSSLSENWNRAKPEDEKSRHQTPE